MQSTNRLKLARRAAAGILMGLTVAAQAQTADEVFRQGLEASRDGDHRAALGYFEQARKAGLESGALLYNLGVTYYELERYPEARAAFGELTDHPTLAPLAYFNLGLIASKSGDRERALGAFSEAAQRTDDPKLKALAAERLTESESDEPIKRWSGAVSVGAGTDDALLDPTQQTATETSDTFTEVFALGSGIIAGAPGDGWRMELSAYTLRHQSFDEYDMSAVRAGLNRVLPFDGWRFEAGVGAEQSTLGGQQYLRQGELKAQARLPQGGGYPGYRLRYRYHAIQSLDPAFDPLNGSRHDLDIETHWLGTAGRIGLAYGLEVNDREDFAANGGFTSYSPTRHRVSLRADADTGPWRWAGEIEYRNSRYDGKNVLADNSRIQREDTRVRGSIGVDYRLSRHWQVGAEYSRTENDSNIADYDYDQNLVTVDLKAMF